MVSRDCKVLRRPLPSVGLYFLRGRHAGKRALAAQGTYYLPTFLMRKTLQNHTHIWVPTHLPTHLQTTATHLR